MHGWQSEYIDGPKGGWSCAIGVVAAATSTTTSAGCSVVCYSAMSCGVISVINAILVVLWSS